MSLTSLLTQNSRMKELIKSSIPSKEVFQSNTPQSAFSSKNTVLAQYKLEKASQAAFVGIATDYMFRFMIARIIEKNKDAVYSELIAGSGLNKLSKYKKLKEPHKILKERYDRYIESVKSYIYGKDCFEDVIKASIFFTKLEGLYRGGVTSENLAAIKERPSKYVYDDIVAVTNVFQETFINKGIVNSHSDVVFNPKFGTWSMKCGGADADIFIDGILYDFKCTKSVSWNWDEVGKVYAYYLLNLLCKREHESENADLVTKEIRGIAIYHSRYGLINRYIFSESRINEALYVIDELSDIIDEANLCRAALSHSMLGTFKGLGENKRLNHSLKHDMTPEEFPFKEGDKVNTGIYVGTGIVHTFAKIDDRWWVIMDSESKGKFKATLEQGAKWTLLQSASPSVNSENYIDYLFELYSNNPEDITEAENYATLLEDDYMDKGDFRMTKILKEMVCLYDKFPFDLKIAQSYSCCLSELANNQAYESCKSTVAILEGLYKKFIGDLYIAYNYSSSLSSLSRMQDLNACEYSVRILGEIHYQYPDDKDIIKCYQEGKDNLELKREILRNKNVAEIAETTYLSDLANEKNAEVYAEALSELAYSQDNEDDCKDTTDKLKSLMERFIYNISIRKCYTDGLYYLSCHQDETNSYHTIKIIANIYSETPDESIAENYSMALDTLAEWQNSHIKHIITELRKLHEEFPQNEQIAESLVGGLSYILEIQRKKECAKIIEEMHLLLTKFPYNKEINELYTEGKEYLDMH